MVIVKAFGGDVDMLGNKIVDMTINDATKNDQPVSKGQLDTKVPILNPSMTGSTRFGVATTAIADENISINQCNVWLNESTNVFTFRIRKSDGTYITKTI